MTALEALLARSRAPGQFVERRSFTLSREKAIEKQREFALFHPRQYLLELVQSAVFAGATYMAIDTRPESLLVAWVGGKGFGTKDLENLFDFLFADRGDARWRHLVQLAIGVNALLQREPKLLRLESGDGKTALRMDLDPSGKATIGQPKVPIQGTYLYAEYTVGWLSRFTSSSTQSEQTLVEERCLYTPIPILLNGLAPFGYRGSRHIAVFGARAWEPFDQEGRRGVVAIHGTAEGPVGFRMVVGGVWISTLALPALADHALYGVICDDALRKTADQSDIVQDRRFVEMLHAVQPIATRLMYRVVGPSYRPPVLPPLPAVAAPRVATALAALAPEPLPDPIPSLRPRLPVSLADLRKDTSTSGAPPPVFVVAPDVAGMLAGGAAAPDRFPWKVLLLTDGQVLSLSAAVPELAVHRLTSKSDVDFVRGVVGRRIRIRNTSVDTRAGRVTVEHYLEGPLPDWGPGVPFCVTYDGHPAEFGGIVGDQIVVRGGRRASADRALSTAFALPRIALRVSDAPSASLLGQHVRAALEAAIGVALPTPLTLNGELSADAEVDGALLGELLAQLAVPQFAPLPGVGVRTEMALPLGWPAAARTAKLVGTDQGPLCLRDLEGVLGTDRVFVVDTVEELVSLDGLERRLGYGHLTHRDLEARPLCGAGRFGHRWVWLEDAQSWSSPAMQQVVWVAATFSPMDRDQRFTTGVRPYPEIVGAAVDGQEVDDWTQGFEVLFAGLQQMEAERSYAVRAGGAVTVGRVEGLCRLALIHLAQHLGKIDVPLLVPSDGGGRRSLEAIRSHPVARVVARRGVRLAEPWTFALTCDELRAVSDVRGPGLRYDDTPEVWRSMSETDQGWLLRQEVFQSGLRGWLGLRCPYDATAGVLLRSTGVLIGLSEIERSVPCHGMLWSEDGANELSNEQRRVAQLAGLRLYQALVDVLDHGTAEGKDAARQYAFPFVLAAWRRKGQLLGTAQQLASRIELQISPQQQMTLDGWLRTPSSLRPAVEGLDLQQVDPPASEPDAEPTSLVQRNRLATRALEQRLLDALDNPPFSLRLLTTASDSADHVWIGDESHRGRIAVVLNTKHPDVGRAVSEPGRAREAILLEVARQLCAFTAQHGQPVDLLRIQQVLLAQRMGGEGRSVV